MVELKGFRNREEAKKALYALKLQGISAQAFYAGEAIDNYDIEVIGGLADITEEEYKEVLIERARRYSKTKENDENISKIALLKYPLWILKASQLLSAEKINILEKDIIKKLESDPEYTGQQIEDSLDVIEFSKGDTFAKEIYDYMTTKDTPLRLIMGFIFEYYSTGLYTSLDTQRHIAEKEQKNTKKM